MDWTKEQQKEYDKAYYAKHKNKKILTSRIHYNNNKEKINANRKERYKTVGKEIHLFKQYGITVDDYNAIFTEQNGKCGICETHQSELKQALSVDHNHKTGEVRGLLCHNCNIGIGYLKDDVNILQNAIQYLNN